LNPHLIHFTFLPVGVIVVDLRGVLIFHTCMIPWIWGLCSFRVTLVQVAHGITDLTFLMVYHCPYSLTCRYQFENGN
jgi:hypothetical protein